MLVGHSIIKRCISLILALSIMLTTIGCSSSSSPPTLSDPNGQIVAENIETEAIITENQLTEFITSEIYLEEFIAAEDKITELLLDEEMINEVILCKTIYVAEDNIEEFSKHSQTAQLFGDDFDIFPVLKKVAIGTGVIVTIAIVKKAGVPQPIASIVVAAADESLKFAASGAAVGTVFGAFTGAADEIDESGRASAIAGFALATVGLIITAVSFASAVPTAGTTGFGIAEGVHLAWAGIKLVLAAAGTVYTAKDTIKAFTSTEVSDIDWDNVDWDAVGVASAQKAIQNGADGYMWGAIYGAIDGTVEGYYQKYCTPYTKYQDRLKQIPKEGKGGHWTGEPGESEFVLDNPIELPDGTKITSVNYQNAVPDFSPYQKAQVKIPNMTDKRLGTGGNYEQADQALAKYWTAIKQNGKTWTAQDVKIYRTDNNLTWHEMSNMESMQLVPHDVNSTFTHYGGVAEYNAMIGQEGANGFD